MMRAVFPPDGNLTLEQLRIGVANALYAHRRGHSFRIRIEDMHGDTPSDTTSVLPLLEKFAFDTHEPHYQSRNLPHARRLAERLVAQGKAYVCTCASGSCDGGCRTHGTDILRRRTAESLPYAVYLKAPSEVIEWEDHLVGTCRIRPEELNDIFLADTRTVSSDFACAVDDMLEGIDTVIDTRDRLVHTARRLHIQRALGYDAPVSLFHIDPLDCGTHDRPVRVLTLLEEGFLPDPILIYLIGTIFVTPREHFPLAVAAESLDVTRFANRFGPFAQETLRRVQRDHLLRTDPKTLSSLYGFADAAIGELIKLHLDTVVTLRELDGVIRPFFDPKPCHAEKEKLLREIARAIPEASREATWMGFVDHLRSRIDAEEAIFFDALRLLMTGREHGPELAAIYPSIRSYLLEVARCPH
jgi:glutamyl-tRNA synthetase